MAQQNPSLSGDLDEAASDAVVGGNNLPKAPEKAIPVAQPLGAPVARPLPDAAQPADPQPVDDADWEDELDDEDLGDDEELIEPSRMGTLVRNVGACFISMITHLIALILLGIIALPANVKKQMVEVVANPFEERPEQELQEIELDPEIQAATEVTTAVFSSAPAVGAPGGGGAGSDVQMSQKVVQAFKASEVGVEAPMLSLPKGNKLVHEVPDGTLGEPRAVVDNYQQAFDRITQEILWMLDKSDVLVIWVFDQSNSMKDDQEEIRDRIEKVYVELGLTSAVAGEHLLTAVTSYGGPRNLKPPPSPGPLRHTRKPTADLSEIRRAINSVPIDPSGHELMCEAVASAIQVHREFAKKRQMMLILVTDETGERKSNVAMLEPTIALARSTKCRIYCMGRESVFGYPYAYMRWKHPDTDRIHWLRIDRGPETGFVEQLQTNGFRRRHDAFPSGFASYEQARMTRETGGIFFMLPSLESNLVRGEKRRYELEQMRAYRPDLRARVEVIADRDAYPLRMFLWKVISDLNPYTSKAAREVELQMAFSLNMVDFVKQARANQRKATKFILYLGQAQKVLEQARKYREQEADPRWQANYDLIYAQIVAYQARLYEYGMALEAFIRKPKIAPPKKAPNLTLVHWDMHTTKKVRTEEAKPYIEKSKKLFEEVIKNHPGTPWAARAKWELRRGFGTDLYPDYHGPYKRVANPRPVPNL